MARKTLGIFSGLGVAALWATTLQTGNAATYNADPSNYQMLLSTLQPGDILNLAAGTYIRLSISSLNGNANQWITITGPASGPPAVITGNACCNTVEIRNSSYLAIMNLRIDSLGIDGAFGISAKDETLVHDIRIEGNTLVGMGAGQQTVGISTKTPTWGWIIRNNQILGAGTGLYLGNSDFSDPFVGGLIENNLVKDTIGYNMEIKDQVSIPAIAGMPTGPVSTIIRNNVFIKNDQRSPDGDRPNVLVGSFPQTGTGSGNLYEIYGNFFDHNPREALLQASGRVTIHDNIFVDADPTYTAVVLQAQNFPLKVAHVYNNTVYTANKGISFGTAATVEDAVFGNLVFAATPIAGAIAHASNNLTDTVAHAPMYVNSPSFVMGAMDFYPQAGKCQGAATDLAPYSAEADSRLDFNGTPKDQAKGSAVFRGAYAGEGTNPGWQLQAGVKPPYGTVPPPPPPPVPTLASISPSTGQAGSSVAVTLAGANFTSGAAVTVSGTGVTVSNVAVTGAAQITAVFTIASGVPTGVRDVRVTTSSGTSNAVSFRVKGRGPQHAKASDESPF
jgi:hypothetical protein